MRIVIFEDEQVGSLTPISWCRPAFAIGCGGTCLFDLAAEWGVPVQTCMRSFLTEVWQHPGGHMPGWPAATPPNDVAWSRDSRTVLINGRLVPLRSCMAQIHTYASQARCGAAWSGDTLAVAIVEGHAVQANPVQANPVQANPVQANPVQTNPVQARPDAATSDTWSSVIRRLELAKLPLDVPLFQYPHDVIRHHERCLQENLEFLVSHRDYHELAEHVYAAPGVTLGQFVVSDASRGPIVLDHECVVEPYAYLCGPAWIGSKVKVRARTQISGGVSVGYASRVGGELQSCMMEAYSNKQHDGFLGHSYVGSWVNLGAGTCVSNLKNSYGEISVHVDSHHGPQRVNTGMRFLGAIFADYVKSAIQTCVFSGKRIGAASNLYGFVTEDVGCFVNYARQLGDVTEVAVDGVIAGQEQMMLRRELTMPEALRRLLQDVFQRTGDQRVGLQCRAPQFTFSPRRA